MTAKAKPRKKPAPKQPAPILLDRATILAADDMPYSMVRVPEWGRNQFVRLRSITAAERDAFEEEDSRLILAGKPRNPRSRLIVLCSCDNDGAPLFTDADIAALMKKGAKAVDRVFAAAQKLNFIRVIDLKELEGN